MVGFVITECSSWWKGAKPVPPEIYDVGKRSSFSVVLLYPSTHHYDFIPCIIFPVPRRQRPSELNLLPRLLGM